MHVTCAMMMATAADITQSCDNYCQTSSQSISPSAILCQWVVNVLPQSPALQPHKGGERSCSLHTGVRAPAPKGLRLPPYTCTFHSGMSLPHSGRAFFFVTFGHLNMCKPFQWWANGRMGSNPGHCICKPVLHGGLQGLSMNSMQSASKVAGATKCF